MFLCNRTGDSHPEESAETDESAGWCAEERTKKPKYLGAHMEPVRAHVGDLEAFGMEHMTRHKHAHTHTHGTHAQCFMWGAARLCVSHGHSAQRAFGKRGALQRQTAGCANCGCEPDDYKSEASTLLRSSCICSTDTRTHTVCAWFQSLAVPARYEQEHVTHNDYRQFNRS